MKQIGVSQIFKATDWHKKWVVQNYSILSSSLMYEGYHNASLKAYSFSLKHHVFIQQGNAIVCYQSIKENENFGKLIAKKIKHNPNFAKKLTKEALVKTSALRKICQKPPAWLWKKENFKSFSKQYAHLLPPFVAIIRSGNFLKEKKYLKNFNVIQKARIKTETIYDELDLYIKKSLRFLAKKGNLNPKLLPFLTLKELSAYIISGKQLPLEDLKKRGNNWGLCFIEKKELLLSPGQTKTFENLVVKSFKPIKGFAKGQTAYPGKAQGKAKIISEPKNIHLVPGEILIASMTRPEFLPLIKKAGAIVTDAGGTLCHAAIVARELKIPCVIGTQTATTTFKDGDVVEVDATKGVIKKI